MDEVVHTLSGDIGQNVSLIIFWLILFQVIFVLFVLWLSSRIRQTSSAKALSIAEENQVVVNAAKAKIDSLDLYIRESFSKDFTGAMNSFDQTASSVLTQMKDELIQSVQRIEQIETAVTKKNQLQDRVERGQDDIQRLIGSPDEKVIEPDTPTPKNPEDTPEKD